MGCRCASSPWVGSLEPPSNPLPSFSSHAVLAFPPPCAHKTCPPHQNTPNGKKIWPEGGGGRRPPFTVLHRARSPAEHGLREPHGLWAAETTEYKAKRGQRSCLRLASPQRDSSSATAAAAACGSSSDAHRGRRGFEDYS